MAGLGLAGGVDAGRSAWRVTRKKQLPHRGRVFPDLSVLGRAAGADLYHVGGLIRGLPSLWRLWLIIALPRSDSSQVQCRSCCGLSCPFESRRVAALTIVAQTRPFVIGVDSHARTFAINDAGTNLQIECEKFPTTPAGIFPAARVGRSTDGDKGCLWAVGTCPGEQLRDHPTPRSRTLPRGGLSQRHGREYGRGTHW